MFTTIRITLYAVCMLVITPAFAQDWYEGNGIVTIANITPEEARRQAFDKARVDALSKVRLEVTGVTSRSQRDNSAHESYDHFIQFSTTRTQGKIVEVDTLFDAPEVPQVPGRTSVFQYRATIRAKIVTKLGESDPTFTLLMSLNEQTYRDGEVMVIKITSSKDCFVTLFNLYSNDSLSVLLPNKEMSDNFLNAEDTLTIPPTTANWEIPVSLIQGKDNDTEAILAIATKREIPFQATKSLIREGLIAQSDALLAVNRWLVRMDAGQRTEKWAFYQIVK